MKIDTEVRRVTKPGANLFLDLGFPPAEAKRLHALSRKHINDTRRLKRQLMDELSLDRRTPPEAIRSRRNPNGIAPARLRRDEQEGGQVQHRYAGRNARPRRQAGNVCGG